MILPERPFLGCQVVGDLSRLEGDVVVLGIPYGVSYGVDEDEQRGLATAPVQFEKRASNSPTISLVTTSILGAHSFARADPA